MVPKDYNPAYEERGSNLNRLLAWGHAHSIKQLSARVTATHAICDQFGDEQLLIDALREENCDVRLEQRPKAESDIAVAAASIVARAEFVASMKSSSEELGITIPFGSSAPEVKEVGRLLYRRLGKDGLAQIAKMHFKPVREIISEG